MEKRRYKIKPPEVWTQVRKDYLSGLDAKTVAARHDVTEASIRARATKEGWSRHPRSEAATPGPQPLSPQDAADLSPDDPNDPAALARAAAVCRNVVPAHVVGEDQHDVRRPLRR